MKRKPHRTKVIIRNEREKKSPSSWPLYSLVATVAIACYLNGLSGDFVHDDIPAVTLNADVLGVNPVSHVFIDDFWGTPMADVASHKSYRPLTILTFRVNYYFFGLEPLWFHLTNILLHSVACILFTRVCLSLANLKPSFAALAGLLFATHPVHTEAVTGIVGRADILACIFFLLSLLAYHRHSYGNYHLWYSVLLGCLSMLAKETGIMVFPLNLAYDFYLHFPRFRRSIAERRCDPETLRFFNRAAKVFTSFMVLLVVRVAICQGSLPKFSPQDNPAAFHPSLIVRILTFSYLAALNWWLLICPATLSHDWQLGSVPLVTSLADSRNLVTCFFFGITLLLAIRCLMDFENQRHTPVVLGVMLLILPFLPASNLLLTVGFVIAERVLYIPSLGSILLVVHGIQVLWKYCSRHRQTILCFVILLLTTGCLKTAMRNKDWRSRESLLRSGLMTVPHNAKMHYNYANYLRDSNQPELAKTYYYKALKLWPTYASAHNNLGTLLDNGYKAEQHFLAAIGYSADHVNAHYNLGQLYRKNNKSAASELMLRKCIALEPKFTPAYLELAKLLGPKDKNVSKLLKEVVELNPDDPFYSTTFGHWLLENGDYKSALYYYLRSLEISSLYQEAVIGATRLYRKLGQKSRLFQFLTRWHLIIRMKKGEFSQGPQVYLQGWLLKSELSTKAKTYDACGQFVRRCVTTSSEARTESSAKLVPNKLRIQHRNKTTITAAKQSALLMVHLLNSV